ncbi:MAG: formylglycine-generating enzyme family protein [Candidatus Cloacimonetes bacterium]|nr:formylglycine-generating enzyme family protein [Candidatus Cloacimonadota bacterium]
MNQMLFIEGGTFYMGSEEGREYEKPAHRVTVSSFYIDKFALSVLDFRTFVESTGYISDAERGDGSYIWEGSKWDKNKEAFWGNPFFLQTELCPVTCVSWFDAIAYCNWKSNQEGLTPAYTIKGILVSCDWQADGYRLPTEAEWEFAARGGKQSKGFKYSGSDYLDEVGWYKNISEKSTHASGMKLSNELDICDMTGNVWEWCWDWYDKAYYLCSDSDNPRGPANGFFRIHRGGSWNTIPIHCTVFRRGLDYPYDHSSNIGFRIAKSSHNSFESVKNNE